MKAPSDWLEKALCANDEHPFAWLSYDIEDIEYAKHGCSLCKVRKECFLSAWQNEPYVGVNAGISEYDFLVLTWKEAKKAHGSNWSRTNKILQGIMQQIA
jgi:hypothetical protein